MTKGAFLWVDLDQDQWAEIKINPDHDASKEPLNP